MAFNTVPLSANGDFWTAANQNTYLRDNMEAMAPAVFTAKGDLFGGTGEDTGAVLAISATNYDLIHVDSGAATGFAYSGLKKSIINRSSDVSVSSGGVYISWNNEIVDDESLFPGSGDTITFVDDGLYQIIVAVAFTAATTIDLKPLAWGTVWSGDPIGWVYKSGDKAAQVGFTGEFKAGDYIKVYVTLGATRTLDADYSFVSIVRLCGKYTD